MFPTQIPQSESKKLGGGCKEILSGVFRVHWNILEGEYKGKDWLGEIPWKGIP